VKSFKIALLLVSAGSLVAFGSCARYALDALYVLPQLTDLLTSITDATT
jgi:hypothetical protein